MGKGLVNGEWIEFPHPTSPLQSYFDQLVTVTVSVTLLLTTNIANLNHCRTVCSIAASDTNTAISEE